MEKVIEWIKEKQFTFLDPITNKDSIYWGNGYVFYGIVTPIEVVVRLHGEVMKLALEEGRVVREAVQNNDPENKYGFNDLI